MVSVSARLCGADAAISNTHFLILNINSDFILIRTSTTASMLSVYHWSESRWQFVRRALPFPSWGRYLRHHDHSCEPPANRIHSLYTFRRAPPTVSDWAMMFIWRLTGKITRTALCCVVRPWYSHIFVMKRDVKHQLTVLCCVQQLCTMTCTQFLYSCLLDLDLIFCIFD